MLQETQAGSLRAEPMAACGLLRCCWLVWRKKQRCLPPTSARQNTSAKKGFFAPSRAAGKGVSLIFPFQCDVGCCHMLFAEIIRDRRDVGVGHLGSNLL